MRLTIWNRRPGSGRAPLWTRLLGSRPALSTRLLAAILGACAAAVAAASSGVSAQPATKTAAPDPLGDLVVTPGSTRPLPRIAILPSLSSDAADVLAHSVVERDLDLSGEVELLPAKQLLAGVTVDDPVDVVAWAKTGVVAVIAVRAKTVSGSVTLTANAYLVKAGAAPAFTRTVNTTEPDLRGEAHRTADLLIGALTGQNGGFWSHMTFVSVTGPLRTVFTIDADGHDARAASNPDELAIAAAYGPGEELYRVTSVADKPYRIRTRSGPVPVTFTGSVYGLAFSKDRSRVAVSVAGDAGIQMFWGPDLSHLTRAFGVTPAVEPSFGRGERLAFSGGGSSGLRIYLDGKPISPEGTSASSPTVCDHPDGARVVFAAGRGARSDLYSTGVSGGPVVRLTAGQGVNSSPACSPDGRLLAFFSTRTTGEGPGLYIQRLDGQRPKRISTLTGTALRWDALPPKPPAATPAKVPPASTGAQPTTAQPPPALKGQVQ